MRVGLLTEGGYPYPSGVAGSWCDQLVRAPARAEFEIYVLTRTPDQHREGTDSGAALPRQVRRVRTAPLWNDEEQAGQLLANCPRGRYGRGTRRRFAEHFGTLAYALGAGPDHSGRQADRFTEGLYGLADIARDHGGLPTALRSEQALSLLERTCRQLCGASGGARSPLRVADLVTLAGLLERALRPLSLDWYGGGHGNGRRQRERGPEADRGLAGVDLCHATSAGPAALPGLLAKRFFGTPLLVTEYGVRLREHYLSLAAGPSSPLVRAVMTAFHRQLTTEAYAQATLITAGHRHIRRWQERCGADPERLRTVYPGLDTDRFAEVGEGGGTDDGRTLMWIGPIEPAKDVMALLHGFAQVHQGLPAARLRIVEIRGGTAREGRDDIVDGYPARCRALAAQLFPDEAAWSDAADNHPVTFERLGDPGLPDLPEALAAASVVVLTSAAEGFPIGLVQAMLGGRATVSMDVGAVVEVIGGTGLVVPPHNLRAFADACLALLRDPARRDRLGAAARARALELFAVERNTATFCALYLELVSRCPVRPEEVDDRGGPVPFGRPVEAHLPGRWTAGQDAAPGAGSHNGRTAIAPGLDDGQRTPGPDDTTVAPVPHGPVGAGNGSAAAHPARTTRHAGARVPSWADGGRAAPSATPSGRTATTVTTPTPEEGG